MSSIVAASGARLGFPSWGRSFWQDPHDGEMICLYASGTTEVNFITSTNSGVTWSAPQYAFPVDDFSTHNNYDTSMGTWPAHVHCVHRHNGSGCYTFLGKQPGGGWAPSGTIARGMFNCRSLSPARDFNGSIEVYSEQRGNGAFAAYGPGAAHITAVDSSDTVKTWFVDRPYTSWPVFDLVVSSHPVGPSGGFPILMEGGPALGVPFSVGATGIIYSTSDPFGNSFAHASNIRYIPIDPTSSEAGFTPKGSGYEGEVPFSPNMARHRAFVGDLCPVLTSMNTFGKFELYTSAAEPFNVEFSPFWTPLQAFFGRVDSTDYLNKRRMIPEDLPFKDILSNVAGADASMDGGVNVDITHYNSPSGLYFYFQQRQPNGDQTISRILCDIEHQHGDDFDSQTKYIFGALADPVSGIISWADASLRNAGAGAPNSGNIVQWQNFKVPQQASIGGSGVVRTEIVATIGSGVVNNSPEGITRLYMWRYADSVASNGLLNAPTFVNEWTADSGNIFTGINTSTGITNPQNLFDDNTATSGQISQGDAITLEFSKALTFNRLEFAWGTLPFLGVDVESSFDDVTYKSVYSLPSGLPASSPTLIKASAENDSPRDPEITVDMDGFAGRYVRMTFTGDDPAARDVREIRLYGGHTPNGFVSTSGFNKTFELNNPLLSNQQLVGVEAGTLPSGWRTSGDFNWGVDIGTHQSGFFVGQTIGSGDLRAIRTDRNAPINSSGVLEVDVVVSAPRTVQFSLKMDLQGNIGPIVKTDPNDDYLELFVVGPGGGVTDVTDTMLEFALINPRDWYNVQIPISDVGVNTLRWVYTRGNRVAGVGGGGGEGAAWIDNIFNLDPIAGQPLTSIYGYINADPEFASGIIYSRISAPQVYQVNAYMQAAQLSGVLNAYHAGEVASTGQFYGYVAALRDFGQVAGYMEGFRDTVTSTVGGYMLNSGSFDQLFGHMQSRFNESINSYLLGPSGAFEKIYGYMFTPQTLAVNGYLKTTEQETVQVNAFLQAKGIQDSVCSYMFASGLPNHSSYAYINAPGALDTIYGYMGTGDDESVAAYIQGASPISGVINSWISGVGFISEIVNGYVPGISGVAATGIQGYMNAAEISSSRFYGHIIGWGGASTCDGFPVPNPAIVAVPTGNFFT